MKTGIDPKVDFAFKKVFGSEGNKDILIDWLNAVLKPPKGHEIQLIEILNPFNLQEASDDKLSILDVKARDQSGRQYNIEMQMITVPDLSSRLLYYWARLYQDPLKQGEDYCTLQPTISICILNESLFPDIEDVHLIFRLWDEKNRIVLTGDIEFHLLQLEKFEQSPDTLTEPLQEWLYFLKHGGELDPEQLPNLLDRPPIRHATEELAMITKLDLEKERYESRRKAQMDQNSFIRAAQKREEQALAKGRAEGKAEGKAEGEEKGKAEGEAKGRAEGEIRALQSVLGLPVSDWESLSELPIEELNKKASELKQKLQGSS